MIRAIHRPRHADVMLIDDVAEEFFTIPLADAPALIASLRDALAIPALAADLMKETAPCL